MDAVVEYFVSNFTNNPIAFSISMVVLILEIVIYQFKGMKSIVIGQCVSNFLVLLTYALGDGLSGAAVCAVATLQTFLIYWFYQKNEKDIPQWFAVSFVAVYLICSAFTYKSPVDIIPIGAAVLFAVSVVQKTAWKYRVLMFVNCALWIGYDILIAAPIPILITHGIGVVSVVVGMIRLDLPVLLKGAKKC